MPSHRKRIGFLPSEEIHNIIEKICKDNKFSQSKLTGLLVEEALISRGVLKNNRDHLDSNNKNILDDKYINIQKNFHEISDFKNKNYNSELSTINQFLEYKLFKKIMKQNKDLFD